MVSSKNVNSAEIKNWSDLMPKERMQKKWVTISLIAVTIILAIAIAIGSYFCCTTTYSYIDNAGKTVVESNAFLSIIPGIVGGGGGIVAGTCAILNHYVFWQTKDDGRTKSAILADLQGLKTLEDAHGKYDQKLRPLVKKEVLTVVEANELKDIFYKYRGIKDIKKSFDSLDPLQKKVAESPEFSQYHCMLATEKGLQARWTSLLSIISTRK